jgi:basic membrane protein A and related proteins
VVPDTPVVPLRPDPRRILRALGFLFVATLVVACDGRGGKSPSGGKPRPFRVALLTPGPITDQSWNAGAYAGLLRIRDSLGADISHIQTKTPAEFDENFRQYGAQGYDLVFGHGFEYQDAALRVAPQFPKTVFVTTSGTATAANVAGMEFAFQEASFLAGMMAGGMTRSNVIGAIGGTELPPVRSGFAAYAAGARSVNPRIVVLTAYVGNWDDVAAAREQALAQIARGADVFFQDADAAGLGVFQAARQSPNVYVFGSNSNQNGIAPDVTLGSVVIDLPHALLEVAREVKTGHFRPRVISLGTQSEVVRLELNPALASRMPRQLLTRIDSMRDVLARHGMSGVPALAADTSVSRQ